MRVNKTNFHMKGFALGLALKQAKGKSEIAYLTACLEKSLNLTVCLEKSLNLTASLEKPLNLTASLEKPLNLTALMS